MRASHVAATGWARTGHRLAPTLVAGAPDSDPRRVRQVPGEQQILSLVAVLTRLFHSASQRAWMGRFFVRVWTKVARRRLIPRACGVSRRFRYPSLPRAQRQRGQRSLSRLRTGGRLVADQATVIGAHGDCGGCFRCTGSGSFHMLPILCDRLPSVMRHWYSAGVRGIIIAGRLLRGVHTMRVAHSAASEIHGFYLGPFRHFRCATRQRPRQEAPRPALEARAMRRASRVRW